MTTLRPLNSPVPIAVTLNAGGEPIRLTWRGKRRAITAIGDRWRIDDDWWHQPIERLYYRLELDSGHTLTAFVDLRTGQWYAQTYGYSLLSGSPHSEIPAQRLQR
ncbi:MAG TPA: hypothetical protein VFD32_18270 [Dehalococcoidia bacterium]|nr:hypothetical protein [Dehalococcoidia bacterium]